MWIGGADIEEILRAARTAPTGLFGEIGKWRTLVEQMKFPFGAIDLDRVPEDAAVKQVAMEVRDRRSDVSLRQLRGVRPIEPFDEAIHADMPGRHDLTASSGCAPT
jgi:hypothetical protein